VFMGNESVRKTKCRGIKRSEIRKGMLPIFFCDPWGAWCLLDTGSNSTVISRRVVENICPKSIIEPCQCEVVTLNGVKPLVGEILLSLEGLSGKRGKVKVHVADIASQEYDVILGCDIMEKVKGCPKLKSGRWEIKLGNREYTVDRNTRLKRYVLVGSACVKKGIDREGKIKAVLREFTDVIYQEGDKLSATGRVRHEIPLVGDSPVYVKPRRYPQMIKEVVKEQITELLHQGIIRKSSSAFNSPVWVVPKPPGPDGKQRHRMVIDFRELNRRTKEERYPLPRIEDILDRMHGSEIFSVLDLKAGYHQILMKEEDMHKTAFSFERGHYEYLRMPFGLKNAPTTFQRLMDEVLEGLDENWCQIYMDDIIIFSRDMREHEMHLRTLLQRLRNFGLKVSEEKSHLFEEEVKFMGHIVSKCGVRPNPEKIEAIKNIPVPTKVKEVRAFLGAMNFYRRYIKDLSLIARPLTRLLQKGIKFVISEEVREAVKACKEALCSERVLKFPDFTRQFIVTTDASQFALGAVLSQKSGEEEYPVAYASRQLNPAETRYSAIERELLGVVWAVEHFRPYLYGRRFQINTDHKPLVWVDRLKESSARVSRWKERLAAYDWTIKHKKGTENVIADWLSRAVQVNAGNLEEEESSQNEERVEVQTVNEGGAHVQERTVEVAEDIVNNKRNQLIWEIGARAEPVTKHQKYGHLNVTVVRTKGNIKRDEVLKILNEILIPGRKYYLFSEDDRIMKQIIDIYEKGECGLANQLVGCKQRVETVMDEDRQQELVKNYHVGKTNHRGVTETVARMKRHYFWIGMARTVEKIIQECEACNMVKYIRNPHQAPQLVTTTPDMPFEEIHGDVFKFEKESYVTLIDAFSKFAVVKHIENKSADEVLNAILDFMGVCGVPKRIVFDNGREFNNEKLKKQMEELDVEVHFSTVGHSRSQGLVERLHNTLTEHLHLRQVISGRDDRTAMRRAQIAYNNSIHRATGYTPMEIVFGQISAERGVRLKEVHAGEGEFMRQKERERRLLNVKIKQKLEKEKTQRTGKINEKVARNIMELIKIGDTVFRKNFYKRRKGDLRFLGPYKVTDILDRYRVGLQHATQPHRKKVITHVNELKLPRTRGLKHLRV
jgi:transposase InsO family protein